MRAQRLVILIGLVVVVLGATVAQATLRGGFETGQTKSTALAQATAVAGRQTLPNAAPVTPGAVTVTALATAASSRPAPTATALPPTPTLPPTATPIPGPIKTGQGSVPAVNAASIVVIDEKSGQILYEKSSHARMAPASVTKIATALVALERGNPADVITAKFDPTELVDSTVMGLYVGDTLTLEDLLYGLMLPSGNDAALAIANHIAGSKESFVAMMNGKARSLGLNDSHFVNPHGLDEEGHYSSAYDLTMMARYGMQHYPLFAKLASARVWSVGGSRPHDVYNLNRFLGNYQGADGVKIGYTDEAGRTTIASATRNGHRVYVGLMRCGDIVNDVVPLMNYVFNNYTWPN